MKKLHLVGLTTDRKNLMLSPRRGSRSGAYTVEIDDDLVQALTRRASSADAPPPTTKRGRTTPNAPQAAELEEILGEQEARARQDSSLSVRDIQARLRRGHRLDEVAKEAGVSREWVARFAAPVVAEQAAVVNELREATFSARIKGASAAPVAESIARNLLDKGVSDVAEQLEQGWRAHQVEGDEWLVRFDYRSRGRTQVAEWRWRRRTGRAVAVNRLAGELAHIEHDAGDVAALVSPPTLHTRTGRSSRRGAGGDPAAPNGASTKREAKRASKRAATTPRSADGRSADTPGARRPGAKKGSAKKAPAKRAMASKAVRARKAATPSAPARRTAKKPATAKQRAATKKATPSRKPAAAKRPTATKRSAAAKKSSTARKSPTAKKSSTARKSSTAKKSAAKRASARKAAPRRSPASGTTTRTKAARSRATSARASRQPARGRAVPATEPVVVHEIEPEAPVVEHVSSNGQGPIVTTEAGAPAAPSGGGRLLPTEDPFAALDLSTGFSPHWRETPRGPEPPASPRLARNEWPPRVEDRASVDADDHGDTPPSPLHRRRAPLRAER